MGLVHADITLKNVEDQIKAKIGLITDREIRQLSVRALVDSGAWTMVINEATREKLGLSITRSSQGTLADGSRGQYQIAGPLEIWWKDRSFICEAVVIPTADENLLGAIPMEGMDLIVNPGSQELSGAHGDQIVHSLK